MLRQCNLKGVTDFSDVDYDCTTTPISLAHIMVEHWPRQEPILAAKEMDQIPSNGDTYIRMVEAGEHKIVESVQEKTCVNTCRPHTKSGTTCSGDTLRKKRFKVTLWIEEEEGRRGPYPVTATTQVHIVYGTKKHGIPSQTW